MSGREEPKLEIDVAERSVPRGGEPQVSQRRLFMQLQVFTGAADSRLLAEAVAKSGVQAVLYEDLNDPRGVGLLTWSDDAGHFVGPVRSLLNGDHFGRLVPRPEFAMFGRTYAIGYEPQLDDWLLEKPRRTACNPEWPWAVWYPLRRSGAFAALETREQRAILAEHGQIGMAYGRQDLAHDIRLACHGLDVADNEFVIGLVGKDLHPLSHLVQTMRSTKQTSTYIQKMGPFFIGRAAWQSPAEPAS